MAPLERIIVVAAPSCCGKSTFIEGLRTGDYRPVAEGLGVGDPDSWHYADAYYVDSDFRRQRRDSDAQRMILHWTIPLPGLKRLLRRISTMGGYDSRPRLELLGSANAVTVVTLFADQDALLRRVAARIDHARQRRDSGKDSAVRFGRKRRNMRKLERFYKDMTKPVALYDEWFRFWDRRNRAEHFLVDTSEEPRLRPSTEWPAIRATLLEGARRR